MLIGITGGIGSGKSAVTEYLRSLGETVICADEIARQVVMPGEEGAEELKKQFGSRFFNSDGILERKKLASHVFGSKELTSKLNDTLHPIIIKRVYDLAEKETGRVFIDAALLIPAGMHKKVDHVWLVTADKDTRIRRVMKRDAADEGSVMKRMQNQPDDDELQIYADEIIDNNLSLDLLHKKIEKLIKMKKYGG